MVRDTENIKGILYKGRHATNIELPLKKHKNLLDPISKKIFQSFSNFLVLF